MLYAEFLDKPDDKRLFDDNGLSNMSLEDYLRIIGQSVGNVKKLLVEKRPLNEENNRNNRDSVLSIHLSELGYLLHIADDKVDLTKYHQIFSSDYQEVCKGDVVKNLLRCDPEFHVAIRCSQTKYSNAFTIHFRINLINRNVEYYAIEQINQLGEYKDSAKEIFDEVAILVNYIGVFLLKKAEFDLKRFVKWSLATGVNLELHSH